MKPFAYGMGMFLVLIFLGHIFDSFGIWARSSASARTILLYLWLEVPFYGLKVIPVATLLATLFCISALKDTGEWVAAQAAGFRPWQLVGPILACAAGVALFTLIVQETILPYCHLRADTIWREQIRRRGSPGLWTHAILVGKPGYFLTADLFDEPRGRLERVVMDEYAGPDLVRRLDAKLARWDLNLNRWVFFDGVERRFSPGVLLPAYEKPFKRLESALDTAPAALIPEARDPEEMSLTETRSYIERLKVLGASTRLAWVNFHSKLAFPFANIVICAFGISFAISIKRGSRALNFAGAIGVAFVYWWFISLGESLGEAGRLSPVAAAWLGNIVFGVLAAFGLARESL